MKDLVWPTKPQTSGGKCTEPYIIVLNAKKDFSGALRFAQHTIVERAKSHLDARGSIL